MRPLACAQRSEPTAGKAPFRHTRSTSKAKSTPNHRGRDQLVLPGEAQWIVAKLAYGTSDKDLEDEDVEIHVQRGCAGSWELLATVRTADGDGVAPVPGFDDGGGRVYFRIPEAQALGVGYHRVRVVVKGDGTFADMAIAVAPKGARVFASDVDGTLTGSEVEELPALLARELPTARPDAAKAFGLLAARGYLPVYLTARSDWLIGRTRAFLQHGGFPEGIVRTMTNRKGGFGSAAAAFKSGELEALAGRGIVVAYGFGNMASDIEAYAQRVEPPEHRVFLQLDVPPGRGRRIESYGELLAGFDALAPVCR